jgi:hypothetical protein
MFSMVKIIFIKTGQQKRIKTCIIYGVCFIFQLVMVAQGWATNFIRAGQQTATVAQ